MKKWWPLAIAMILLVVAGGAAWYLLTSPQYSLMQVRKAVEQHDAAKFEKYVDLEGIIRRAGNQLSGQWSASLAKELGGLGGIEPEMVNGIMAAFGSAMIEPTVKQIREAVLSFIETGRSMPIQTIPGDAVDIADEVAIASMPSIERQGKMAIIDLDLVTLGETVKARLFMRNLGTHWQIAEIDQVPQTAQEVLAAYARGERKRIAREKAEHPDEIIPLPGLSGGAQPLILCYIPAGKFMMGSPDAEEGHQEDEGPRHKVTLTQPFWMGKHEVTNGQFEAFVKDTGHITTAEKQGNGFSWDQSAQQWGVVQGVSWRDPKLPWPIKGNWANHPVVMVSWDDAAEYCAWLSIKTGTAFQLPTEAQWEYACRAGTSSSRYWGDSLSDACDYGNFFNKSMGGKFKMTAKPFPCEDGYEGAAPVGTFKANAFGLDDMLGNVWEWCYDWYGGYPSDKASDPRGPADGEFRVLRGGSWGFNPENCRSAGRGGRTPADRSRNGGFRVVRTP